MHNAVGYLKNDQTSSNHRKKELSRASVHKVELSSFQKASLNPVSFSIPVSY